MLFAGLAGARAAPPDEIPLDESLIVLNVPSGYFRNFLLESVGESVDERIELTIEKANASTEWGASSMICVPARSSSYEACLRIAATAPDTTALEAHRLFFKDNKMTLLSQERVPGSFKMGDKVLVALRSGPDTIEFKVDDGAWLMQALPASPQAVRLNCS